MTDRNPPSASLGELVVDRQVLPIHLEALHAGRGHAVGVGVVQREGRKLLEQNLLGLLVDLVGLIGALRGGGLGAQLVELGVLVVAVVRTVAVGGRGGVQLVEVVLRGRVVWLPAGAEGALDGAVGHVVTEFLEGRNRVGGHVDAQGVLHGVHHGVEDRLRNAVGVVGEGELAVVVGDGLGLGPQFLGLLRVVLQVLAALEGVGVARGERGGEFDGRGAQTVEHLLADGAAVDGHGQRLTAELTFLGVGLPVFQRCRDGEGLAHGAGLAVRLDRRVGLEGLGSGGRDGVQHVEVAGLDVGVCGLVIGVDLEGHTVVLHHFVALVGVVLDEFDLLVVAPGLELVRTVADRLLAEGLRILVEGFRQRGESAVADLDGEHGVRLVQVDGELVVVDDLEAFELLVALEVLGVLQLVEALDGGEERGALLRVLGVGDVAPGLGEGFGGHWGAVSELPAALDLDVELGAVVIGLDGLGDFVLRVALRVVGNQTGEQQVDRDAAAGLVGVARDERVLRFGIVCGDDVGTLVSGGATVGRAATAEQHTECACGRSESQSFLLHGIHILLIHYFQSRKALFKKKAGVNTVASTSVFVLMVGSLSLD